MEGFFMQGIGLGQAIFCLVFLGFILFNAIRLLNAVIRWLNRH